MKYTVFFLNSHFFHIFVILKNRHRFKILLKCTVLHRNAPDFPNYMSYERNMMSYDRNYTSYGCNL